MDTQTLITTIVGLAGMSWIVAELLKLSKSVARIDGRLDKVDLQLENVGRRFDEVNRQFEQVDRRFEQVDRRFEQVDRQFEQVDRQFEQVDKRFEDVYKRLDKIDTRFDKLPCGIHQSAINKLELNVAEEQTFLRTKFPSAQGAMSARNSPSELNEYGRKVYADMEGDEFLRLYGSYFLQKMECISPKTALDVESASYEVLLLSTYDDIFNQIKVKVYHYPSMDIINRSGQTERLDVSLADVCYALSLKLRDMYLETHPSVLI